MCAALLALAGCKSSFDNGFAVDLTLTADPSLTSDTLSAIRIFSLEVEGAERATDTLTTENAFADHRQERILYRPKVTSGMITLSITARGADGGALAFGQAAANLKGGSTTSLTVLMTSNLPPQPDLSANGPDFAIDPRVPVVTPQPASVARGMSLMLTSNLAVTWRVLEPNGGSIDANGNYTAPSLIGTYHVLATSVVNPDISANVPVSVVFGDVQVMAGGTGGSGSVDGTGATARFSALSCAPAVDGANGLVYIPDRFNRIIRKLNLATGDVTTIAGRPGFSGSDDGIGSAARFVEPYGAAVDSTGTTLYVSDYGASTIRKIVLATGAVTTLAGVANTPGEADDAMFGVNARFSGPTGLALDSASGNLYVADFGGYTIRKVKTTSGATATVAGVAFMLGAIDTAGGTPKFYNPTGLAYDGTYLYVADAGNQIIRKLDFSTSPATVTTLAGTAGSASEMDGTGTGAHFYQPTGIAAAGGVLYITDTFGQTVRALTISSQAVVTLAGGANVADYLNASGLMARFHNPEGIAVLGGNAYVMDGVNFSVRKITGLTGGPPVTTFAGTASQRGVTDAAGSAARFDHTTALAADSGSNFYVADYNNSTIRKLAVAQSGGVYTATVSTLAGMAKMPGNVDMPGTAGRFSGPVCLVYDGVDSLYVCDQNNNAIRKVRLTDQAVSTLFTVTSPNDLTVDEQGRFFVTSGLHVIYQYVPVTKQLRTLWGTPAAAGSSDGVGAQATFRSPTGIVSDHAGLLYVADTGNNTLRRIDVSSGLVTTVAGKAGEGGATDGPGAMARFSTPLHLQRDGQGTVYVADSANHTLRQYDPVARTVITSLGVAGVGGMKVGPPPAGLNRTSQIAFLATGEMAIISDDGEQAVQIAH
jgi:hypothetical protein